MQFNELQARGLSSLLINGWSYLTQANIAIAWIIDVYISGLSDRVK